jgi:redox-sensitive bicupin YhaK (pirin superfamily)
MITIRKSSERGQSKFGGLVSFHSFSFGEYYDKNHSSFHSLRVINDDILAGGFGFPTHPHRNMEIITYVTEGAIEHQDSMGNKEIIHSGELQRMSAGSGIQHSEYNASETAPAKLLQIWIHPAEHNIKPSYEQKQVSATEQGLTLVVSPNHTPDTLHIHQNARILVGRLRSGESITQPLDNKRVAWMQIIDGEISVNTHSGMAGDGIAFENETEISILANSDAHFLFFDLGE